MRTFLALLLLLLPTGHAQGSRRASAGFRTKQFGSVPGMPHNPTPDQDDFQQNWGVREPALPRSNAPPALAEEPPGGVSAPTAAPSPVMVPALGPGPRRWIGPRRPAATESREEATSGKENELPLDSLSRYSPWKGLTAPAALPARMDDVSDDEATGLSREDFSRRVLGEEIIRPDSTAVEGGARASRPPSGDPLAGWDSDGGLFVAVELDGALHGGNLKDAAASFSRASGFSPDERFPAEATGGGRWMNLWGWIPARSLGDAAASPIVTRLEIGGRIPRRLRAEDPKGEVVVLLRLPLHREPRESAPPLLARLSRDAGFSWKRMIGIQRIPRSEENALIVSGEVPLRLLGRVLADPAVVRVMPAPGTERRPPQAPRRPLFPAGRRALLWSALALTVVLLQGLRARRRWVPLRT